MTTLDLKILKAALTNRAKQLVRSLAERNQIAIERAADPFDATLLAAQRESSAQNLSKDLELLRQVEAARDRMRDGTYGTCLFCEEAIAPKRLQAILWAAYCLSCQALSEEAGAFRPNLARAA
jgi:DnaK suppressor protein